jgi:hypothetical protein
MLADERICERSAEMLLDVLIYYRFSKPTHLSNFALGSGLVNPSVAYWSVTIWTSSTTPFSTFLRWK